MLEALVLLAVLSALLALNALYVAAEFAAISVPRPVLEVQAEAGEGWARRLLDLVATPERQDRFIAVAQVGITLSSLGLGMYGEHSLAAALEPYLHGLGGLSGVAAHGVASAIALAFLTFWHIVLGEMIPKSLALLHPLATARTLMVPMQVSAFLMAPLVWVLNGTGSFVLRLLGQPVSQNSPLVYSNEELEMLVEESHQEGLLETDQRRMLRRALDFGAIRVSEVAVPRGRVVGIPAEAGRQEVLEIVREQMYSRYPVYRESLDHVVGLLHVKDLYPLLLQEREFCAADVARPVPHLPQSAPLDATLETLRTQRINAAVVVDEFGQTAGMVTLEDLEEELFGEIRDEFDADEESAVRELPGGGWLVAGELSVRALEELLGTEVSTEADTVGGLFQERLVRPARSGDTLEIEGFRLVAREVEGPALRWCSVEPQDAPPPES